MIGIYIIKNTSNNKFYIGSSISINIRWKSHISYLKRGAHHNKHLQAAWNKYTKEAFIFEVLELTTKDKLLNREQFYMDTMKPEYNKAPTAGSPRGFRVSEETKRKLSISHKGLNTWMKGRKLSLETRQKLSLANKGRKKSYSHPAWNKGLSFSLESRQKMSLAKKGKKRSKIYPRLVRAVIRNDNTIFDTVKNAALAIGAKPNTIVKHMTDTTNRKTVKGFSFTYYRIGTYV